MSPLEKTLQQVVLAINKWPFGIYLTRIPYYAAVLVFRWQLRRFPLILAAYARNSFAYGTWVPGRSDIDLTVVLRAGGSPQAELDCVRKFRKCYASLERWFPMLGEVEIISEAHLDAWTRFTAAGYESRDWLCLYGKNAIPFAYRLDAEQRQRDRVNHAINIYRYLMVPALGKVSQQILVRYVEKIMRYLDEPADTGIADMTPVRLQVTALQKLENAVTRSNTVPGGDVLNPDLLLGKTCDSLIHNGTPPTVLSGCPHMQDFLDGVLQSANHPDKAYYIPQPGLDGALLEKYIVELNPGEGTSIIMPRAVLIHYLEMIDPLEHLALLQNRTVLWGNDPLGSTRPLLAGGFNHAVCAYSTHILLAPYKPDLELMSADEFHNLLFGWILRTARYFEDNIMEFDYGRLREYWRREHPGDNIEIQPGNPNEVLQRYMLVKRVADDIATGMLSVADNNLPASRKDTESGNLRPATPDTLHW